jgi:hypothetical protein
MNYFDRQLESELRNLLDPIVNHPAPLRKGRKADHQDLRSTTIELLLETETLIPIPLEVFA